jgi:hypothetical protein
MKPEVEEMLATIHKPKRLKDQRAAIEQMNATCHDVYDDLVAALAAPEYEHGDAKIKWAGPTKMLIVKALFQKPTKQLVADTAFLVDHEDTRVADKLALCVAQVGFSYALDVVERCLSHPERSVRAYASYGLRDVAQRGHFPWQFAMRAGELLLRFIREYPNEAGQPRFFALEVFDPNAYQALMAATKPEHPSDELLSKVFAVAEQFTSHRGALAGFDGYPEGYRQVYALRHVDAEIRNGGIYQLYANTTWCLILDAISGLQAFGLTQLADTLKGIVFYYHKSNRSRLKRRMPEDFFKDFKPGATSLADLEDEYYDAFDALGYEDIKDVLRMAVTEYPGMFKT